jgi:hypothetical protein
MYLTLPSTLHKGNVERNEHRGDETENETRPNRPKIQRGTALAPEEKVDYRPLLITGSCAGQPKSWNSMEARTG